MSFIPGSQESVLIFGLRYALGRKTGASVMASSEIVRLWDELARVTQKQIQFEVKQGAVEPEQWREVLALPLREVAA